MSTQAHRDTLESLVDRYGVAGVLQLLAQVCRDKAYRYEHDTSYANSWYAAARHIDAAEHSALVRDVRVEV